MIGFPIYGKGITPWSGPKRGPFEINVPVCCGGVIVHPGDIVVADEDGAVVVPQETAAVRRHGAVPADLADRTPAHDMGVLGSREVAARTARGSDEGSENHRRQDHSPRDDHPGEQRHLNSSQSEGSWWPYRPLPSRL